MKRIAAVAVASALGLGVFAGGIATAKTTPTIKLLSASAKGPKLSVKVSITGLKLAPKLVGKAPKAGVGHFHVFVNGKYVGFATAASATITPSPAIASGKTYKITVQLAQNNHSPIGKASNAITVKDK
jgi:hypothetical protein